jgi:AraC-like DNA-binding protein
MRLSCSSLEFSSEALDHLVNFIQAIDGPPALDPRLARVLQWLNTNPADPTPAGHLAEVSGLSVSRFLHLFSQEIGVPFRRFRIWIRLRAASQMALSGRSLTDAAHSAGFSDSAHFARLHRDSFGVTPSYTFRKLARVGKIARSGTSDKCGPSRVSPEAPSTP